MELETRRRPFAIGSNGSEAVPPLPPITRPNRPAPASVFGQQATFGRNKIRVIQRRACGLRDEEYLRLKVVNCVLPKLCNRMNPPTELHGQPTKSE